MGLFEPIWMKKNLSGRKLEEAKMLVGRLDKDELKTVALKAPNHEVRRAAIEYLTDQSVLLEMALKDVSRAVRILAVRKITNQKSLARIVKESRDSDVRIAAINSMTDQTLLGDIAISDLGDGALQRITDKNVLKKVARNSRSEYTKISALTMLAKGGDVSAIDDLVKCFTVSYPLISKAALDSIKEIYKNTSSDAIKDRVRQYKGKYGETEHVDSCAGDPHTDTSGFSIHIDVD